MSTDFESILEDLDRMSRGDAELENALNNVYRLCRKKGISFHELFRSKLTGTIKYILTDEGQGKFVILDLDTGQDTRP